MNIDIESRSGADSPRREDEDMLEKSGQLYI